MGEDDLKSEKVVNALAEFLCGVTAVGIWA